MFQQKKFFLITAISLPLIFCVAMGIKIYLNNNAYSGNKRSWVRIKKVTENFDHFYNDNVILGPSLSNQLDGVYLTERFRDESFVNLSANSTRLKYTYFAIKKMLNSKKLPRKIYFLLVPEWTSDYNLGCDLPNQNSVDSMSKYYLTKSEAAELDAMASEGKKECLGTYKDTRILRKFYFEEVHFAELQVNKDFDLEIENNRGNPKRFVLIENSLQPKDSDSKARFANDSPSYANPGPLQKMLFQKILKMLAANNIDYEIFFSPHYKEIDLHSTDATNLGLGNYFSLFGDIPKEKISNKILVLDNGYFIDHGMHLGSVGIKIFNDYFLHYVVKNKNPNDLFKQVDKDNKGIKGFIYDADTSLKTFSEKNKKISYRAKNLPSDLLSKEEIFSNSSSSIKILAKSNKSGFLLNGPDVKLSDGLYKFKLLYSAKKAKTAQKEKSSFEIISSKFDDSENLKKTKVRTKKYEKIITKTYAKESLRNTEGDNETLNLTIKIENLANEDLIEARVFYAGDFDLEIHSIEIEKLDDNF